MEKPLEDKGITFYSKLNTSCFNELWVGALEMPWKSEGIATFLWLMLVAVIVIWLEMPWKSEGIAT